MSLQDDAIGLICANDKVALYELGPDKSGPEWFILLSELFVHEEVAWAANERIVRNAGKSSRPAASARIHLRCDNHSLERHVAWSNVVAWAVCHSLGVGPVESRSPHIWCLWINEINGRPWRWVLGLGNAAQGNQNQTRHCSKDKSRAAVHGGVIHGVTSASALSGSLSRRP